MKIQYIILLLVLPTFWAPVYAQQNPLETDSTHYKKWHIERIIPIPDQASEMVQDRIASIGQPDVENAKNRTFPDEQAWLDFIERSNSGFASRSQSLAEKLDVSVMILSFIFLYHTFKRSCRKAFYRRIYFFKKIFKPIIFNYKSQMFCKDP